MFVIMNKEDASDEMLKVIDVFEAYNTAAALLESDPIALRYMKSSDCQTILGENFRVNVFKNGNVGIVMKIKGTYSEVIDIEDKLNERKINHRSNIDGRQMPVIGIFKVMLDSYQEGLDFIGVLMEIFKIK